MLKVKTIIFDFDGTIADTFDKLFEILERNQIAWKLPKYSREDMQAFRNLRSQEGMKRLGIPLVRVPELVMKFRHELHKAIQDIETIDGIADLLQKLHQRQFNLGILTSNSKENVETYLRNHNIESINFVYTTANLWGKDKELLKVCKDLNINPKEILYVGDETRDIEGSKKAGVQVCAVTWGFQGEEILKSLEPDFIINKPAELLNILE